MKNTESTHTDVCLDMINCPFLTLTEDEVVPNVWYHPEINAKFFLTSRGFKVIRASLNGKGNFIKNAYKLNKDVNVYKK